jgi:metal-sulfur cluster biosynthetic enzyme
MPIAEESIYAALRQVQDPELLVNIVDLGLVYEVQVTEVEPDKSHIHVKMTMTSPACPAGPMLIQDSRDVLLDLEGVEDVEIEMVMSPPWTPDRMTEEARDELGMF